MFNGPVLFSMFSLPSLNIPMLSVSAWSTLPRPFAQCLSLCPRCVHAEFARSCHPTASINAFSYSFVADEIRMKPLNNYFSDTLCALPDLQAHHFFQIHG